MNIDVLLTELTFKSMRSGGPGGQHVNKTESKVEVTFNIETSKTLSATEKEQLLKKLGNRISADGEVSIQCSDTRSQHRNKKVAIDRLIELLREHLKVSKRRKKTKPSRSAIERRLKAKKHQKLKKKNRKPPQIP